MTDSHPAEIGGNNLITPDDVAMSAAMFDIRGCKMDYVCTKLWSDLVPTQDPRVRTCLDCSKPVTFCTDQSSLEKSASSGACVAFFRQEESAVRMTVGLPSSGKLRAYLDGL